MSSKMNLKNYLAKRTRAIEETRVKELRIHPQLILMVDDYWEASARRVSWIDTALLIHKQSRTAQFMICAVFSLF
jgi:hypothetical protein